ncbi:hypothetical protein B5X24_HaOG211467 [Helicoverpa armigera]|nr:hypothetical protein B5X24_HaOG211467 [Helicoverpa armigera]
MEIKLSHIAQITAIICMISIQTLCAEDHTETPTYFEEITTITFSQNTVQLVNFLESLVMLMTKGDRPVKRYFDSFSSPFHGLDELVFSDKPVIREEIM